MSSTIDPYKVLNLPKNFTMDQLKTAFRTMAVKVHPDKGGNDYMFKLVTACYKALAKEYNRRVADKQYHELKSEFAKNQAQPQRRVDPISNDAAAKGFNIEKFNKVFVEHKVQTAHDSGYGSFLQDTKDVEQKNIFAGKKVSSNEFNRIFESHVATNSEQNKFLVKYKEPEALLTCKKIGFVELGEESIDDFSGANTSRKNLNYMDLKIAHTTSRIYDPNTVEKRREYRNVEDLERDRGGISYSMNDEDREYYEKKKHLEEIMERKRKDKILETDRQYAEQFDKVHRLLLGRR